MPCSDASVVAPHSSKPATCFGCVCISSNQATSPSNTVINTRMNRYTLLRNRAKGTYCYTDTSGKHFSVLTESHVVSVLGHVPNWVRFVISREPFDSSVSLYNAANDGQLYHVTYLDNRGRLRCSHWLYQQLAHRNGGAHTRISIMP